MSFPVAHEESVLISFFYFLFILEMIFSWKRVTGLCNKPGWTTGDKGYLRVLNLGEVKSDPTRHVTCHGWTSNSTVGWSEFDNIGMDNKDDWFFFIFKYHKIWFNFLMEWVLKQMNLELLRCRNFCIWRETIEQYFWFVSSKKGITLTPFDFMCVYLPALYPLG